MTAAAELEPDLDLPARIRAVVEDTGDMTPNVVWAKVVAGIPEDLLRVALLRIGGGYVRTVLTSPRRMGPPHEPGTVTPIRKGRRTSVGLGRRYSGYLAEPVHVGRDHYKALGDCTTADLRYAVSERVKMATGNKRWAAWYRGIADAMDKAGVAKVADLNGFDFGAGRK